MFSCIISQLKRLYKKAFYIEDLLTSQKNNIYPVQSSLRKPREGKLSGIVNSLEWNWYLKIQPVLYMIIFGAFTIFAFLIILGECSLFSDYNFALFGYFLKVDLGYFASIIIFGILIVMLSVCTYHGIFNFKLTGLYGLYPYRQTDPASLVYSSLYHNRNTNLFTDI